jgi:hypothetical protein
MGTQPYLPAGWARQLESRLDSVERVAELEKDRFKEKGDIREILDRLAEKHGATVRDVRAAMLSIDDTLSDETLPSGLTGIASPQQEDG